MNKSYSTNRVLLTSFVIITLIILPVVLLNSGNLYLVGDYMSQQIPFIKESRRLLLSGKPFWSNNTFLGANFLGTYSFYNYASPFYWPLFVIPEKFIGIGLSITFIIRHMLAAVTAHIYLKRYVKTEHFAFIGALLYAFSSFTMDSTYYFHFIDVIAVFPLIPYLVDEVLEGRKKVLLSLTVLLSAMINYYFIVSTSVFFLIYLFFRVKFSEKNYTFKDALRCIIFYAVGGISSMFILLPSALSLLETHKATGSFATVLTRGLATIPQLIRILKGIVLPSEGILGSASGFALFAFNSNSAFIPFFGALFLFIAVRKKSDKWYYKLIKLLFILSVVPFGNGIFSLFTNMNYTRWWYGFVLMGILASIKILEEKPDEKEVRKSAKAITIISAIVVGAPLLGRILCAYVIKNILPALSAKFSSFLSADTVESIVKSDFFKSLSFDDFRYMIVFVIMTAATYLPLYFSLKKEWIFDAKKVVPVVAVICVITYSLYLVNEINVFEKDKIYRGGDVSSSEEVLYTHRTSYDYSFANYPAVINEPGITTFISFKSHSTAAFCDLVGYENTLHLNSKKFFDTPAIQSVLSIKNLTDKNGNTTQAPYYTPFGFTYDYYVLSDSYEYTENKKENNSRIETMTYACFVDSETAEKIHGIVKPLDKKLDWKEARPESGAENFVLTSSGFTAVSDGEKERLVFFSIPHDNGWKAYINGKETEILTINGGLMGIIVPAGESCIEFEFTTPGLKIGIIISAISISALAIYYIIDKTRSKKG